jgi:PAS domain S-box-containing protein
MEFLKCTRERYIIAKQIALVSLLLVFIVISSYVGLEYYRPFHIIVEAFSSFIAFSIFITALNSYELSNNIPFLFIGIAYGFAGGFNVIHMVASKGVGFFPGDTTNLAMIFSVIPRGIRAVAMLICLHLVYKSYKFLTPFTITAVFSVLSAALLGWIFILGSFPISYIPGYGSTPFKIAAEIGISIVLIICSMIIYKGKKFIDANVFLLLQCYLYTAIACNFLLIFYTSQQEITNVLAHILKVISSYCIYRAIVKVGLKTPYKLLFNELDEKNTSLKLKESELRQAVYKLQRESELRKNIEEMLFRSAAGYKLLVENSKDTIVIYDDEGIIFANAGAAYLLGVDKCDELLGKPLGDFFQLTTDKTTFKPEGSEGRSIPTYEAQLTDINGKLIPVEASEAYITYDSKPAVLSLIRDMSTHKQIEEMKKDVEKDKKLLSDTLEFNRLITEFFSNISHELRTPLNVILSALQVLSLEGDKHIIEKTAEKKNRYIKMIKQNCYRLLRLINNLIDITRIDSGYVKAQFENHNIVSVVEDITLSVKEYVENKGIELIFDTNVEEKVTACDPEKLERIMLNLISNAVKFTNEGDQICVEVLDQGENIRISVKDTGVGIPQDKLQIIFERFRQADNGLSRNHEGSGIGLSLVKALVELHGGTISVKSSQGEGSEFVINLPSRRCNSSGIVENAAIYRDNTERINIELSDI